MRKKKIGEETTLLLKQQLSFFYFHTLLRIVQRDNRIINLVSILI